MDRGDETYNACSQGTRPSKRLKSSSDDSLMLRLAVKRGVTGAAAGSIILTSGKAVWISQTWLGSQSGRSAATEGLLNGLLGARDVNIPQIVIQSHCPDILHLVKQVRSHIGKNEQELSSEHCSLLSCLEQFQKVNLQEVSALENSDAITLADKALMTRVSFSGSPDIVPAVVKAAVESISLCDQAIAGEEVVDTADSQTTNTTVVRKIDRKFDKMLLRFDGGARGNPGPAGAGAVMYSMGDGCTPEPVWQCHKYLGQKTNNEAEYAGLIEGLRAAQEMGVRNVIVEGDSNLVVQQVQGKYRVRAPNLRPLCSEAQRLMADFDSATVRHIKRAENQDADRLANHAMDTRSDSYRY